MIKIVTFFTSRKKTYRELMITAFPLILSTASWSIMQFTDRMFLTWYSPESVAASMPAGILNFTFAALFIGTASYTGTFVAQYYGAGSLARIGKTVWQGLYIALLGGVILFMLGFAAEPIFRLVGHAPEVQKLESIYFSILCFGSLGPIASSVFSGFYSGKGDNMPVMWINFIATAANILFDYILIFGHLGFPAMGIQGAAVATVIAGFIPPLIFTLLIFSKKYNRLYGTAAGWRFDRELFLRILRFGLPSGVHMFIEIAGFTGFLLIVGRLGTAELAATNIALNINSIAFMPMIGFGIAISMVTGRNIGKGDIPGAVRTIWSAFHLCFGYMGFIALTYFFLPGIYIYPFAAHADPAEFSRIGILTVTLLKFVALYSIFDTLNMVFASAIKGAGDTRFVMLMGVCLSACLLVIPSYIAIVVFRQGLYTAWIIATAYISILGLSYLVRFLTGKWKHMKVIEHTAVVPTSCPDVPFMDM